MPHYDSYNREERAICSHLFRLLHESLNLKEKSPLGKLLDILLKQNLDYKNGTPSNYLKYENVAIYCEMAMIRDAYFYKKDNHFGLFNFLDDLTKLISRQEDVSECRLYSELPPPLNVITKTHPKQIRQKVEALNINLTKNELKVYGAMQGMFNAKPDLVITIDNLMLVCEAKFTEKFDQEQLNRTWNIAEVWTTLLYEDLGFKEPPVYTVFKLGAKDKMPDISWEFINEIAKETYNEKDRTRIAINTGVELLKNVSKRNSLNYSL